MLHHKFSISFFGAVFTLDSGVLSNQLSLSSVFVACARLIEQKNWMKQSHLGKIYGL